MAAPLPVPVQGFSYPGESNFSSPGPTTDPDPGPGQSFNLPVSSEQLHGNWYTDYRIDSRYDTDMGLLMLDVAGPYGQSQPQIVRTHVPSCRKVVKWTAERVGAIPDAPSTNTNNPNEVLAHKTVLPCTPVMAQDGTQIYRLSGTYVYYLLKAPAETDRLSTGTPAFDTDVSADNDILPSVWKSNLGDSSSSANASGTP